MVYTASSSTRTMAACSASANQVVIDNDGPHPAQDVGRLFRFSKGYLPIRINYFEATGDAELSFFIEDGSGKRSPAAPLFFHSD